jgi:protein-disulfide isomerase
VKITVQVKWTILLSLSLLASAAAPGKHLSSRDMAVALSSTDLGQFPAQGDPAASVVLLEFASFECPYCRRHAEATFPQIVDKFVRTGKIRYVFVYFPLDESDLERQLSTAAQCAQRQGRFWEMHDALFHDAPVADSTGLARSVAAIGLDAPEFQRCAHDAGVIAAIGAGKKLRERFGVRGTPWFVMARGGDGHWTDVSSTFGARPFEFFDSALSDLLGSSQREDHRP